ncbi:hypothetical protein BD309DRAFT_949405 [Dichomitus squalens]|nr:hypothetical protein BD309DRAFT_949405 [Dichomitus squalens]
MGFPRRQCPPPTLSAYCSPLPVAIASPAIKCLCTTYYSLSSLPLPGDHSVSCSLPSPPNIDPLRC